MCTAIAFNTDGGHFFGRNLDIERTYGESIVITPRDYEFNFKSTGGLQRHYAIIGVGIIVNNYPLYYDGTNEHGLAMAGLNFVGNAKFQSLKEGLINIAPYEFIPYILGKCKTVQEAKSELESINLIGIPFSDEMPLAELHYIIADKNESIVVEPCEYGLHIYDDPVGVITNNPHFPYHLDNLMNYKHLSPFPPKDSLAPGIQLSDYSLGMGAVGLPGDTTSASRFIRAVFSKLNSRTDLDEEESVAQVMHIMASVEHSEGVTRTKDGKYERTEYSIAVNLDTATYYYHTYGNSRICAVSLFSENTFANNLISYKMNTKQDIFYHN